jgi:nucleotide-binding universal stress UspA family protein
MLEPESVSHGPPVVCGVDRSDRAPAIIRVAAALAEHLRARLVLVHAAEWPSLDPLTRRSLLGRDSVESQHRRQAEAWLRGLAADAGVFDADVRVDIGVPSDWLLAAAHLEAAALIVVGRSEPKPNRTLALDSVSADLVRRAPCPVLVVPSGACEQRPGAQILCGIGDRQDIPAAHLAAALAAALDAPLTLAHVLPLSGVPTAERLATAHRGASKLLRDVAERIDERRGPRPTELRLRIDRGDPAAKLAELAAGEPTAMIVVRSRRRGALRSAVLGSVSRRLARLSPSPVLVHPHGAQAHLPAPPPTSRTGARAARAGPIRDAEAAEMPEQWTPALR